MRQTTSSRSESQAERSTNLLWPGIAIALLIFLAQLTYWVVRIHGRYFPAGDEFSLLVNSTRFFHPHMVDWFRHGFAGYFSPYPDLSLPYSNFLRPVANITFWIGSVLFGRHWEDYLFVNYLIQAAVVLAVWYLARVSLCLPSPVASLVTLSATFSPAFGYQTVFRPAFAFDLLGALWALLTMISLLRRNWWLAWIFVILAMFTKESAYYVALSASAAAFTLLPRLPVLQRLIRAAAYLVPLATVLLLRKLAFSGGQGVYVLNEAAGANPVKKFVLALTHWPYMLPGEQHIFEVSAHNLVALLLVAVGWLLLLTLCVRVLHTRKIADAGNVANSAAPKAILYVLLIFLAGSLLLPIALDLGPRFGTSTTPLFFLCIGVLAVLARSSALLRWTSLAFLAVTLAADAAALGVALTGPPLHREEAIWARSRNMIDLLSREEQPVTFLVGDATESFASPVFVQRFSGYHGVIVPLSNLGIGTCPHEQLAVSPMPDTTYEIHLLAPYSCGGNTLGATFHITPQPVHAFTRSLPQADVTYDAHKGGWENGQFSSEQLDLKIVPKVPAFSIVFPPSESSAELRQVVSPAPNKVVTR